MLSNDRISIFVFVFALKPHETFSLVSRVLVRARRTRSQVLVFVSFSEIGAKSAWRCVPKQLPPTQPDPLIFCMTSDSRNTTFVIECCKKDFCNRNLKPQLHPRNKEGIVQIDLEVTKTLQVARASAATLLSHSFSLFILLFLSLYIFLSLFVFAVL